MKTISRVVNYLFSLIGILYLVSIGSIIFSAQVRTNESSIAYTLVDIGCSLNQYALFFLTAMFILFGMEFALRAKSVRDDLSGLSLMNQLKKIFADDIESTTPILFTSSLSRVMLMLFFMSQLSYMLNHCT